MLRAVEFLQMNSPDYLVQKSDKMKWVAHFKRYCQLLKIVEEYTPRQKLRDTDITLVKSQDQSMENSKIGSHFGLTQVISDFNVNDPLLF